ncbi:MAG: sigma-70 family RNA polymerase sigma factor [Pirellulales bacterium]
MADDETRFVELLRAAQAGNEEAQGELFDRYRKLLKTLVRLQLKSPLSLRVDASDLVQETLLRAYERFDDFRGQTEGELVSWIQAILASRLALAMRHHFAERRDVGLEASMRRDLESSSMALSTAFQDSGSDPREAVWRHERALRLASAIEDLPEDYRTVILLHHIRGLTYHDVGQLMGRSAEAVRKLWVRGLAELKRAMEPLQ